jgi:arylsulfatase A-like enzyme
MGCDKKDASPNIDAVAKESTVFKNAFSAGPVTPHSFPSILTSTYPLDYNGPIIEKPRLLISELLQKNGYCTAGFHSNPFLGGFFGYNQGWDFFEEVSLLKMDFFPKKKMFFTAVKEWARKIMLFLVPNLFFLIAYLRYRFKRKKEESSSGKYITKIAKDFISSRNEDAPFFLWVHYMDVHYPYFARENVLLRPLSFKEYISGYGIAYMAVCPTKALKKTVEKNLDLTKKLYLDGVSYVDGQIKEIVDLLKQKKIYDNSVLIITSDHGDEFLEHGSGSHQNKLYNELLKVPLLIKIPGKEPGKNESAVSLVDLPPTICDLAGVETDAYFKGKNLFINNENVPVFSETGFGKKRTRYAGKIDTIKYLEIKDIKQCKISCQSNDWKFILNYDLDSEELYNLQNDPKEQENLVLENTGVASQMRRAIDDFKKKNPPLAKIKQEN